MANPEHLDLLKQGVEVWNAWRQENERVQVDLSEADLRGAYLYGADLIGANLQGAKLNGAHLTGADLTGADLNGADLNGADLTEARLATAHLIRANLTGAILYGAYLWSADLTAVELSKMDLRGAKLTEANLTRADLTEANLTGAKLMGANLTLARLTGAKLIRANLQEANLTMADLIGADLTLARLTGADLTLARLTGADLQEANLTKAILDGANLTKAHLTGADLSKTSIDATTRFRLAKGVTIGVNGLYSNETNTAAIMLVEPPPDSMQGANPEAVIESLKRARRLHSFSFGLAALSLAVPLLSLTEITLPFLGDQTLTPKQFSLIGLLFSTGALMLVKTFLEDALSGARYVHDRIGAMKVGSFPWSLSRYAGKEFDKRAFSLLFRLVLAYHPVAYAFFPYESVAWYHGVLGGVLLIFCTWIFWISEQFQRPILFDPQPQEDQESDLARLVNSMEAQTKSMKAQTAKIAELVDFLKATGGGDEDSDKEPDGGGDNPPPGGGG